MSVCNSGKLQLHVHAVTLLEICTGKSCITVERKHQSSVESGICVEKSYVKNFHQI